jgi:hypothetical protein
MQGTTGCIPAEREIRLGYRSGCYGRTPITRIGKLELRVPQDRARRKLSLSDEHIRLLERFSPGYRCRPPH